MNDDLRSQLETTLLALERRPDDAELLYRAGAAHLALGEYDLARNWLQRALRFAANRPVVLNALARAHFEQNEHRDAERCLRESTELEPHQRSGWALLAELLLLGNRHADSIRVLRAALDVETSALPIDASPDQPRWLLWLGMCELLTHDTQSAISHLTAALDADALSQQDRATAERYLGMAQRMAAKV